MITDILKPKRAGVQTIILGNNPSRLAEIAEAT